MTSHDVGHDVSSYDVGSHDVSSNAVSIEAVGRHLLNVGQFTAEFLEQIYERALALKALDTSQKSALPSYRGYRACLFFDQPSTRTKHSFINACHLIGIQVSELSDLAQSSVEKGESLEDTLHTLLLYNDILIVRSKNPETMVLAEKIADTLGSKFVINAGSGSESHPTQTLLDWVALRSHVKTSKAMLTQKNYLVVGDYVRGRAAKSWLKLIEKLSLGSVALTGPKSLMPEVGFRCFSGLKEALKWADVVYMMRMQKEYGGDHGDADKEYKNFGLTHESVAFLKPSAVVMHPMPRGEEIPPWFDADPRALYWEQELTGLYARAALLETLISAAKK